MEECSEFIVQCPYIKYGCKKECKRGELETHRKEAKEYHTEVVSVFMTDKVDSLEKEKKEQAAKIQELEAVVNEFSYLKDYLKLNGIVWRITNRDAIVNRIHQLWSEPETAANTDKREYAYDLYDGMTIYGPRFAVQSFYDLHPTLSRFKPFLDCKFEFTG